MIPSTAGFLNQDFEITEQPSKTYKMDLVGNSIRGYVDGINAVRQAIFKILNTERYEYIMYSWNYGVELKDLYGKPTSYVCPELERRITEALIQDDRIDSVDSFEFDTTKKSVIHVTFVTHTVFGDVQSEKEVSI